MNNEVKYFTSASNSISSISLHVDRRESLAPAPLTHGGLQDRSRVERAPDADSHCLPDALPVALATLTAQMHTITMEEVLTAIPEAAVAPVHDAVLWQPRHSIDQQVVDHLYGIPVSLRWPDQQLANDNVPYTCRQQVPYQIDDVPDNEIR